MSTLWLSVDFMVLSTLWWSAEFIVECRLCGLVSDLWLSAEVCSCVDFVSVSTLWLC